MRKLLVLLGVVVAIPTAPASAQQTSPPGCSANAFNVSLVRSAAAGRVGSPVAFRVAVEQQGGGACDVRGVNIDMHLPGADGAPSPTATRLVTNANFSHDMGQVLLPEVPWTIAVNPGVTWATARVSASGTLQDVARSPVTITKLIGVSVVAPKLSLAVTAEPATGTAPLDVTYRFALTNAGTPPDPLSAVKVQHPFCTPEYASGDTDGDEAIDAGETWLYACTHRFATAGQYTSTSTAVATSASDGQGVRATALDTIVRVDAAPERTPVPTVRPEVEPTLDSTPTPTPSLSATISTLAGKRKVAANRKVTIATIACPTGATCSITAPRTAKLKIGKRSYTVPVTAAKTLAGGKRLNVTLTLPKAAYARLKSASVSVRLSAKATGTSATSLTVKAAIKR